MLNKNSYEKNIRIIELCKEELNIFKAKSGVSSRKDPHPTPLFIALKNQVTNEYPVQVEEINDEDGEALITFRLHPIVEVEPFIEMKLNPKEIHRIAEWIL